jgi:periplasmic divalent cation tolerance protein
VLFKHKVSFNLNLLIINKGKQNSMPKSSFILAITSVPTNKHAHKISKDLLEIRLVACVNIIDKVDSMFRWNNKIVLEREVIMIIKTIKSNDEKLKTYILNNHPYDNPELIFLPIDSGLNNYLKWIEKEVF